MSPSDASYLDGSACKPDGQPGIPHTWYGLATVTGTLIFLILAAIDLMARGVAEGALVLLCLPLFLMIVGTIAYLGGLPVFLLLRIYCPARGMWRLIFMMLVVAPLSTMGSFLLGVWISGLSNQSPYFPSPSPPFIESARTNFAQSWPVLTAAAFGGCLTAWLFQARKTLFSEQPAVRKKARLILAGLIAIFVLPVLLGGTGSTYWVIYRAEQIAGTRPYCLLVPDAASGSYVTATARSQLSIWNMHALYMLTTGTRSGFYSTNHALLVLGAPTDYMNWSYRHANFEHIPKIGDLLANSRARKCEPALHFGETL